MRHFFSGLLAGIFFFFSIIAKSHAFIVADNTCDVMAGTTIVSEIHSGSGKTQCTIDAQELGLEVYGFYLCQAAPVVTNPSASCVTLFDRASNPFDLTIAPGSAVRFPADAKVSLPPGTYTYSMILIAPNLKDKVVKQFATPKVGNNDSVGHWCWSNGSNVVKGSFTRSSMPVTCGTEAEATAGLARSTQENGWVNKNNTPSNETDVRELGGGVEFTAYVLESRAQLATVTGTSNTNATTAGTNFLAGVTKLGAPASVTMNTTSLEVGFGLENNGQIVLRENFYGSCAVSRTINGTTITADNCVVKLGTLGLATTLEAK